MRVNVTVDEVELENDDGWTVAGLTLTCERCGHTVEVFGTEIESSRRGAVMLREECPEGSLNFYVVD